jgi:hypothetical protein
VGTANVAGSVAVTGSVNVANTPSVNVANTPGVTVSNQPTVHVAGGVKADTTPAQPFQTTVGLSITDGNNDATGSFTAPAGTTLVIEFVSAQCQVTLGQRADLNFSTSVNGAEGTYSIPLVLQHSTIGYDHLAGTQLTRVYADPGSSIDLYFRSAPSTLLQGCSVSFSGYQAAP